MAYFPVSKVGNNPRLYRRLREFSFRYVIARLLVRVAIAPLFLVFLVRIYLRVTYNTGLKGSAYILIRSRYIGLSAKELPSIRKLVLHYIKVADISLVGIRLIRVFNSFGTNNI